MNIEINPDYEKSTTLRALSAFLTLLADEADGSTKDAAILSAIVQKGLNHVVEEHEATHFTAHASLDPDTAVGRAAEFLDKPSEALKAVEEHLAALNATQDTPAPKRTRRTKAEMEEDARAAGEAALVVTGDLKVAEAVADKVAESAAIGQKDAPTIDDVRAALQRYTAVHGMPEGIALLKNYGAGRISELKDEQYPLFIAECDAPVAEAA